MAGIAAIGMLCLALGEDGCRSVLTVNAPLNKPAAIVLLAGSHEERAPAAATLYRAGNARRIILADDGVRKGWSREHQRNLYAIERSEELLVRLGVPRQSIVRLPFGKSGTVYDALAVRDYVVKHDIRSILLVTSDYHTRRSLWIFERVLWHLPVTIGIAPARSRAAFFPDIILEYIKLVYYRIRFGLFD